MSNNNPFRGAGPSVFPRQLRMLTTTRPTAATTTTTTLQCLVSWAAANPPLLEQNRLPRLRQVVRRLRKLYHPPSQQTLLPWPPPRHWPTYPPPPRGAEVLSRYLTTSEASGRPRVIVTGTKVMMTWGRQMRTGGNSGDTHLTRTWANCQTTQGSPPSLAVWTQPWAVSSGRPPHPPALSRPRLSIKLVTHKFLFKEPI